VVHLALLLLGCAVLLCLEHFLFICTFVDFCLFICVDYFLLLWYFCNMSISIIVGGFHVRDVAVLLDGNLSMFLMWICLSFQQSEIIQCYYCILI